MTAIDVLREFVADCETAYPAFDGSPEFVAAAISDEWPDLASTYLHAKDVLAGVLTTMHEPIPEWMADDDLDPVGY